MNWEVQVRSWLAKVPLDKVRLAALVLLTVIVAYLLAALTQQLLPATPSKGTWQPPKARSQQSAQSINLAAIQKLSLFGSAAAEEKAAPVNQPINAPKTKLNVKLTGVVASTEARLGSAIIESQGAQATYGVGDKIDGTRAVVKEIYPDRVIIRNSGRLETLQLEDQYLLNSLAHANPPQQSKAKRTSKMKQGFKKKADVKSSPELDKALQSIASASGSERMAKLTDYVRISPVREGGQLKGFRINPGKDRTLFNSVGLKANDLAVSLNGYDLTDMGQSAQVMRELQNMTDMSLTVDREGQLYEFLLELPSP